MFLPRGAELVGLWAFDDALQAVQFESSCHRTLESLTLKAFATRQAARDSWLVPRGDGWTECYQVSPDWRREEILEALGYGLVGAVK